MKSVFKTSLSLLLIILTLCHFCVLPVVAETTPENTETKEPFTINAPSAILMEASTGTICYAKDANKPMAMASVTKVMTLLLIFEAIDNGRLSLAQEVTISEHAASMGGSQVFLEPGEVQTVETLIKCISIASANDAAVTMAEAVAGTEEQFVAAMNEKAHALHMENTNFVNCCGLDVENHYSCANDLALASRELITKYPQIFDYCQIWQEDITHTTQKGSFPFTLTNTNKLLKQYPYATGLKTGSTSIAKFCLAATAQKDDITFIAVIMGADTPKDRFQDARTLFEYGFLNTSLYYDNIKEETYDLAIQKGCKDSIICQPQNDFSFLAMNQENLNDIQKKTNLPKSIEAPCKKGSKIGSIDYYLGDKKIGSIPVVTTESVSKATFSFYLQQLLTHLVTGDNRSGR